MSSLNSGKGMVLMLVTLQYSLPEFVDVDLAFPLKHLKNTESVTIFPSGTISVPFYTML
ncbi:MAG TPA: hypothetical protein VGN61_02335 [Verrucomicrobiae bacterium]